MEKIKKRVSQACKCEPERYPWFLKVKTGSHMPGTLFLVSSFTYQLPVRVFYLNAADKRRDKSRELSTSLSWPLIHQPPLREILAGEWKWERVMEEKVISPAQKKSRLALDITYISSILLPQTHDPILRKEKNDWVLEGSVGVVLLFPFYPSARRFFS